MSLYRGYDQAALDAQYDNQRHCPEFARALADYARLSAEARTRYETRLDLTYGPGARQSVDVLLPNPSLRPGPVHVFLHGGAWRALGKAQSAFTALTLCEAGAVVVAADFDLTPQVDLDTMVAQARDLLAWTHHHAQGFGGDPGRVFIAGHSSGAHMAAMVAGTDWTARGLPLDLVKGALLVSGIYDLEPVRLSYRNALLGLDEAAARRNSPLHHPPPLPLPVMIVQAEDETAEFTRQSRALRAAWDAAGTPARHEAIPDRDHFTAILDLARPGSRLARIALDQMGLAASTRIRPPVD